MRPFDTLLLIPLIVVTATAACAGSARRTPLRHDVISASEIALEQASTAYDLVERLRPFYLRGRTVGVGDARPLVFRDDVLLGEISMLRGIPAREVLEIRYVRGEEMLVRQQEASGRRVILVVTRRN
jgi:hypothetical protein